ncbi:unnamed protein product [Symbiodinium natans]|uniref:Uncharacterized protein n=1 Tax=Symbiodinium natans TaxID=878477 RepID=A0A812IBT3_9DINO|nr:unnamed protein product [Symbiodinium natans]
MVEGGFTPTAAWDTVTAEMERLAARAGQNSLEDFALHRAREALEQLRRQTAPEPAEASAKAALRAQVAMERKRHEALQERIDEAKSQAKTAEENRAMLQAELEEVSRKVSQNVLDSPRKQAAADRVKEMHDQLAAAKVEARQVADETRAMAVERYEIEKLITEAQARQSTGSTTALGQDQVKAELLQIAHRASDNARTLQEAMAEVSSKAPPAARAAGIPETSAAAAFLNSDLGRSTPQSPQSKMDISKGLFHSSGGLQHLANRGRSLATASSGSLGSPTSTAYRGGSADLESIQERLNALRGNLSDMANQRQHPNGTTRTAFGSAAPG